MDARRFDAWTRNRALRLDRRNALRLLGASGVAATLPSPARGVMAQTTCTLTVHAEIAAGPSAPITYDGALQLTLDSNGGISDASFTPAGGVVVPASGHATGRALDLQIELDAGRMIVLSGVADQPFSVCPGSAAGLIGGPQPGDLGGWYATSGALPATDTAAPPLTGNTQSSSSGSCAQGQTACGIGCVDKCPPGQFLDSTACVCIADSSSCLADRTACAESAQCCSGLCTNGECRSCSGAMCNGACVDPLLDPMNCGGCGNVCTGECLGGECLQCDTPGAPCTDHAECCGGICTLGVCRCAALNEPCRDHFDCCLVESTICANRNGGWVCRQLSGEACSSNSDCLDDLCVNGICD